MSGIKDDEVDYAGEASFHMPGRVTISIERFNHLIALQADHARWREGLERMAGAQHQMTILAAWPFALSMTQMDAASNIITGCMVVAENLLAGRRWNEREKPG
jgi:hypothetical protein